MGIFKKMNFLLRLSFCLLNITFCLNAQLNKTPDIEATLKSELFSTYNNEIRPNQTVNVGLGISLLKIISIDEVQGIMHSSIYLYTLWMDSRLAWNPDNYSGIVSIYVPINKLWLPDFFIINSADSSGFITLSSKSLGVIWFNGIIVINIGLLGKYIFIYLFK